jgi:hypothetical protein
MVIARRELNHWAKQEEPAPEGSGAARAAEADAQPQATR